MDMERGGKRMCSECADFGELCDWIWALVFDCPLDLCFETGALSGGVGTLSVY